MATLPKSLNIVIVGAGISGLALATALAKDNHNVTVLESSPSLREFGAMIGLNPNGVRLIKAWGLAEAFAPLVSRNKFLDVRDGSSGEMIGHIPLNARNDAKIRYDEDHWIIHRRDLQDTLARAAEANGARIVCSSEVARVDSDGCVVHCKDGRTFEGEVIVGADGIASTVRAQIASLKDVRPMNRVNGTFRCTVPKARIRGNPKLDKLLESGDEYGFLREGTYLLFWALPEHRDCDIALGPTSIDDVPPGRWGVKGDPGAARALCEGWCPEVVELMQHIDVCVKWRLDDLPPMETCRSENGRVVLIGDAWHAMLPHAGSGGSASLEDAAALAKCLTWSASHPSTSLSAATHAFETLRTPRVRRMQAASLEAVGFLEASDPKIIAMRNEGLAAATRMYDAALAEPEEVRRGMGREKADMHAPHPTEPYMQWMYGYDVVDDMERYLKRLEE